MNPAERAVRGPQHPEVHTRPDVCLARRAAGQWGVVTLDELRMCGMTTEAVKVRVRNGWLHPLHRGVYAVGHPNPPLEGRFLAGVLACGVAAVLSHFAAATLYKLVRWDGRYPEVTAPNTRRHRGIRVHRSQMLEPRDTTRHEGIPITSPARTLVDLAATFTQQALRRTVREAQALKLVTFQELVDTLDRLGPRRGSAKLANILATGPAPTRSELEDVVLDLILKGGFAHPDVNVPLRLGNRTIVPDLRWPDQMLVVEADGSAWHDHRLAREDDAERQALLEAHGHRVLRVTWHQAIARRAQTQARLRAPGAPRQAATLRA